MKKIYFEKNNDVQGGGEGGSFGGKGGGKIGGE